MSTYREALLAARAGSSARLGEKVIRFLTSDEAGAVLFERDPRRAVRVDADGKIVLDAEGNLIVDIHAPASHPHRLGLFDVSVDPPVEFSPTEDDVVSTAWLIESKKPADEKPATVEPETVDEVLTETVPETLGELDTEPPI